MQRNPKSNFTNNLSIHDNSYSNTKTTKAKFRKLALTSLLIPALNLSQSMAFANQVPVEGVADNTSTVIVEVAPSSKSKQHLMAKLSTLAFFSADFSQQIISGQGELLQQGTGNFAISKPNLAHWQTVTPDETLIVSDGNTLWFYDPFIEQVSAFSLAKSIHNTPILLLTSDEPQLWAQYDVLENEIEINDSGQKISRFVVIPKDASGQIKKLTLSFLHTTNTDQTVLSDQVTLTEFSFQDATGQISQINLTNFNSTTKPQDVLFTFSLPEGVRLEDKR